METQQQVLMCRQTLVIPLTCVAFTNGRWEVDKWPIFLQVDHFDELTGIYKWQIFVR